MLTNTGHPLNTSAHCALTWHKEHLYEYPQRANQSNKSEQKPKEQPNPCCLLPKYSFIVIISHHTGIGYCIDPTHNKVSEEGRKVKHTLWTSAAIHKESAGCRHMTLYVRVRGIRSMHHIHTVPCSKHHILHSSVWSNISLTHISSPMVENMPQAK